MLKIQRSGDNRIVFKLSGRIETPDVEELRAMLKSETAGRELVMDLADVTLVNQEAVDFLSGCERSGIKVERSPAYVREWIDQVKGGATQRKQPAI